MLSLKIGTLSQIIFGIPENLSSIFGIQGRWPDVIPPLEKFMSTLLDSSF